MQSWHGVMMFEKGDVKMNRLVYAVGWRERKPALSCKGRWRHATGVAARGWRFGSKKTQRIVDNDISRNGSIVADHAHDVARARTREPPQVDVVA